MKIFGTHCGARGLEKVFPTELERIFLEYEAKHILKVLGWDRRVVVVESFVCFAYCYNSFLLWYVQALTSKDTKIVSGGSLDLCIKLVTSLVSLRYGFCCRAISWSSLSTKFDSLSVGPLQPEMIGPPTGFGLWMFVR